MWDGNQMTEPCTKEAELARIDERTETMKTQVAEIHKWMVGSNGDGVLRKIKGVRVQIGIQWGVIVLFFGVMVWILRS